MFLCVYVPTSLSASTTTAKQIQSKPLKLEDCHHNSRVNVPKLPFSTRVNIQTLHVSEMRITLCPHGAKTESSEIKWAWMNLRGKALKCTMKKRSVVLELEACIGFPQPGLHEINKSPCNVLNCCIPEGQVQATAYRSSSVSELVLTSQPGPVTLHYSHIVRQNTSCQTASGDGTSYRRHIFWINPQKNAGERRLELQRLAYRLPPESHKACWDNAVPTGWVMFLQPRSCEK